MALRPTTLRFSELAYDLIRDEANEQGITVAQYIREAALVRAVIDRVDRNAKGELPDLLAIVREVRRLSQAE